MTLTQAERDSVVWKKLEAYITERRDHWRKKNDTSFPIDETQKIRGRIDALNDLLSLQEEETTEQN